jgi:GTP-binding protein
MKFVDEATIEVKAGKGGAGAVSFRREKFVPLGGPDGGDGGRGGSVILVADPSKRTLLDFSTRPIWKAQNGKAGAGSRKTGKNGEDLLVNVPPGTEVLDYNNRELLFDIVEEDQKVVLAQGGRGGKGNDFFKSATNRAPDYAQPGEEGEEGRYILSLKLLADVGLLGLPNAGKSTLISRISASRPKIADYPFTTLVPNLGVVKGKGQHSFVVADIPGLIPGASEGKGLGIAFLKHIERTAVLCHLIDLTAALEEPQKCLDDYKSIRVELKTFSAELLKKPEIIVLTKADLLASDPQKVQQVKDKFEQSGCQTIVISSATSQGIQELIDLLSEMVFRAPM